MSRYLFAFFIASAFIFMGSGCANTSQNLQDVKNDSEKTSSIENLTTNTVEDILFEDELILEAEALGPNTVSFDWNTPEDMDTSNGWRILSSSKPEPKLPGAFWDQIRGEKNDVTLKDVKSGKRYLRICQWSGAECEIYSNEIILEVK